MHICSGTFRHLCQRIGGFPELHGLRLMFDTGEIIRITAVFTRIMKFLIQVAFLI